MTYVTQFETEQLEWGEARRQLIEAETEYQRARSDDYVALIIRDSAIVDAHRSGLSSREISELVGDMGQPNVVRARRRAVTRREIVPAGLLSSVVRDWNRVPPTLRGEIVATAHRLDAERRADA